MNFFTKFTLAMNTTLSSEATQAVAARLRDANTAFARRYPGESGRRQPVHTVYGGAHLFRRDSAPRLGALALRALEEYAPDSAGFAQAIGLPAASGLRGDAQSPYARVVEKLRREPVEDFRIDFEDGYGNLPDDE